MTYPDDIEVEEIHTHESIEPVATFFRCRLCGTPYRSAAAADSCCRD